MGFVVVVVLYSMYFAPNQKKIDFYHSHHELILPNLWANQ